MVHCTGLGHKQLKDAEVYEVLAGCRSGQSMGGLATIASLFEPYIAYPPSRLTGILDYKATTMSNPAADHQRLPLVLVVDDEDLVRQMSGRTLQRAGYHVVEASDGARALGILMQGGVDAIVTDIRMPGMDGWELAGRVARMRPRPPILFMSGYDTHTVSPNFRGPFLAKPFRSEQLVASVRRLLVGANCPDRRD